MALSHAAAEAHIATWQATLKAGFYPFRERWPGHLFHHAPLENARLILTSGNLLSRNDSEGLRGRDIAGAGVIDARIHAHDSVRFYFRPRTPTQFHIEGIRRVGECAYGNQAPMLFMFVVDAVSVLTAAGTSFCDRNMQLGTAAPNDTDDYFGTIPFDKVYSFGSFGGDNSIKDHRAAEVLATSPMPLAPYLRKICCRSEAERDTLLASVDWATGRLWRDHITVSDDLQVFEKRFPFVQSVQVNGEGVTARIGARFDGANIDIRVLVEDGQNQPIINVHYPSLQPAPPNGMGWIFKGKLADDIFKVSIFLEGQLAYQNWHAVGEILF